MYYIEEGNGQILFDSDYLHLYNQLNKNHYAFTIVFADPHLVLKYSTYAP